MKLVDAHCHLEADCFADTLDTVLADARQVGIAKLLTCAITPSQWAHSAALAEAHEAVAFAWGIHPWHMRADDEAYLPELRTARERGAVALGEFGLDKKIQSPPLEAQYPIFEAQLRIACDLDLPVNLHCRGAFNEMLEAFKRIGVPRAGGILHSFAGSPEVAGEFMRLGLAFSLGGILTYRNSKKRQRMLRSIWPDHFLLETDSPDIPPVERRGETNVPANIRYNLTAAAEILEESEEHVAAVTAANARRIFGLEV